MLAAMILFSLLAPTAGPAAAPVAANVCADAIADLEAHLRSPRNHGLALETSVIVGGNAYAEHSAGPCGEGCTATGEATLSPSGIVGASSVAVPGFLPHPLKLVLSRMQGKARLEWSLLGKTYQSDVDRCTGGLWTAAQGSKSAIIVQITENAAPPK